MRIRSRSLGEFALDVVRIDCERCDQPGAIAVTAFGGRHRPADLLVALASCERGADFSRPCGARYADLTARYRVE